MKYINTLIKITYFIIGMSITVSSIAQNCGSIVSDSISSTWNANGSANVTFHLQHKTTTGGGTKAVYVTISTSTTTYLSNYCISSTSTLASVILGSYTIPASGLSSLALSFIGITTTCANGTGSTCSSGSMSYYNYLPIELLNFYATCNSNQTMLEWTTTSESNNNSFIVEAYENEIWVQDGQVLGSGTTTESADYKYYPTITAELYRLKSKDFDGIEHISDVVSVNCNNNEITNVKIFPNPTKSIVNFSEPLKNVVIKDLYGKQIKIEETSDLTSLDVSQFRNGVYVIYYGKNDITYQSKIIVL
jgi:hypothetical protein